MIVEASDSFTRPVRPPLGNAGRKLKVNTNFFPLNIKGSGLGVVHQYQVDIIPDVLPALNREVFKDWQANESKKGGCLYGLTPVFDGRHVLFCHAPLALPNNTGTFQVPLAKDGSKKRKPFELKITKVSEVDMSPLEAFVAGKTNEKPDIAFTCLDLILRHVPSLKLKNVGRSFFNVDNFENISDGVAISKGTFLSVRPARGQILLNMDTAAASLYQSGPLVDVVAKFLGKRSPGDISSLNDRDRLKLEKFIKNLQTTVTFRSSGKTRYKILGLLKTSPGKTFFQDNEGKEKSVEEFFQETYKLRLNYPQLPCVQVGKDRPIYIPMEGLAIVKGQRYMRKLNDRQTADMIKITCQKPHDRASRINAAMNDLERDGSAVHSKYNIAVGTSMVKVDARVLPAPTVIYNDKWPQATITPEGGAWNLRDKGVFRGARLEQWSVAVFGTPREFQQRTVENFVTELGSTCKATGLDVVERYPKIAFFQPDAAGVQTALATAAANAVKGPGGRPQIILCLLPDMGNKPLYEEIKRVCDTIMGVPSQCVLQKHVIKANKQYCANVCLKINVKLGGVNCILPEKAIQFLAAEPTLLMGADVTHPGPGDKTKPSIAAVVGSCDRYGASYCASIRIGESRQEIIGDLGGMTTEILRQFYRATGGRKPKRILFYRDGVSEGQFDIVLAAEVKAIQLACGLLEKDYCPKITFIIVQKRHHARLFPMDRRDGDRSGNVMAGTVVESGITHPFEFDFYLCSHAGLQGTSRPTHYHVLYDQNNFSCDELQSFTNNLCYIYAKCTRSVSVAPPAYYAHLVAARARLHRKDADWTSESSERPPSGDGHPVGSEYAAVKEELRKIMYFC